MADILSRDASEPQPKRRRTEKPLVLTLPISEDPRRAGANEPVVFAKPIEIARASKHHPNSTADGKAKWTWDASAMDAYIKPTKLPLDLNHKYESWKHIELGRAELDFEPIMKCLQALQRKKTKSTSSGVTSAAPAVTANVVTWRGNITKIMITPYNKEKDWEIGVYRRNGVIYFDSRETAQTKHDKTHASADQLRFTYMGYKFENYCTGKPEEGVDTSVLGVGFYSVCRTRVGEVRVILAAECDTYMRQPTQPNYIELKTSKNLDRKSATFDKDVRNFERYKLLKYWAQSFSVGIPKVVVGFRTPKGLITKMQAFDTVSLPRLVLKKNLWKKEVCLRFLSRVLEWVTNTVLDDQPWLLRLDAGARELKLIRGVPRKSVHVFSDPALYDAVAPAL